MGHGHTELDGDGDDHEANNVCYEDVPTMMLSLVAGTENMSQRLGRRGALNASSTNNDGYLDLRIVFLLAFSTHVELASRTHDLVSAVMADVVSPAMEAQDAASSSDGQGGHSLPSLF